MLVRLFASEIINGDISVNDVPAKLKDGVISYLLARGLNENGSPLQAATEQTIA